MERAKYLTAIVLSACLEPTSQLCDDGVLCPLDKICVGAICTTPEQAAQCAGMPDGTTCTFSSAAGTCNGQVCIADFCGDGVINGGEECDGTQLNHETCESQGYYGETTGLACDARCRFNYDGCVGFCNDGVRNGLEQCDGSDLGDATCRSLGFYDDTPGLKCTALCAYDTSACTGFCGDGITNGPEACDAEAPAGVSCQSLGFELGALGCTGLCLMDSTSCDTLGFQPMPGFPTQTGINLLAIWANSPSDVFVTGRPGRIVHYDGTSWTVMTPATGGGLDQLVAVWGSGPGDVFAVVFGTPGAIQHYDGQSWSRTTVPDRLRAVWGSGPSDVFAVGDDGPTTHNGVIDHYDGFSWSPMSSPSTGVPLLGVWGSGPSDVFAVGIGTILHYDGTSSGWSAMTVPVPTDTLVAVWGRSPTDVYVVGTDPTVTPTTERIYHYDGLGWSVVPAGNSFGPYAGVLSHVSGNAREIFAVGSSILHSDGGGWAPMAQAVDPVTNGIKGLAAAGNDLFLLQSTGVSRYRGLGWVAAPTAPGNIAAMWGASPTEQFGVGSGGAIFQYDGGAWTPMTSPTTTSLGGVWGSSATDVFAVGQDTILHYDGVNPWSEMTIPGSSALTGVWGSGPMDVYAVGTESYHYDGMNWSDLGFGGNAVWGSGPTDVWVVGGDVAHFDGLMWTHVTVGQAGYFFSVWGSGPSDVWAVSQTGTQRNGSIAHFDGSTWTVQPTDDYGAVGGSGPADVYIAGNFVRHYDGVRWSPTMIGGTGTTVQSFGTQTFFWTNELVRSCVATERDCHDGFDDDCDGLVDCADPDCAADPTCNAGGVCQSPISLRCNATTNGTTVSHMARIDRYACDPRFEDGKEAFYELTPATSGQVTVHMDATVDLDLVVMEANAQGACDPFAGCTAAASTPATSEDVTFTAVAGKKYIIAVEGYDGAAGPFTIRATCP
jgi:hypothetical protein